MKNLKNKILLIGIGNCARGDDGLGWAFLDALKKEKKLNAEFVYKYQLNIEDAEMISEADDILFIDAFNGNLENGFSFEHCEPKNSFEFTTHALNPGVVLKLANNLFNAAPEAHVLSIQGVKWELGEGLSATAIHNLEEALSFFKSAYN